MQWLGASPSVPADLVTKAYADGLSSGGGAFTGQMAPTRCATTGAETYTIVGGTITQIAGTVVDGVSPAVGERILVTACPGASGAGTLYSYTTNPGNGVYVVTGNTTNLTVSRTTDASGSINPIGAEIWVTDGTIWNRTGWFCVSPASGSFTWGTSASLWTQYTGADLHINSTYLNKMYFWNGTGQTQVYADTNAGNMNLRLPGSPTDSFLLARSVTSVTTSLTFGFAVGHEYIYLLKSGAVPSLPSAVTNQAFYRVKNTTAGSITLSSAGGTIDGSASVIVRPNVSLDIVSDGSNWFVI